MNAHLFVDNAEKKNENILMTDTPYWTPVGDADNIWDTEEVSVNGCVLEVSVVFLIQHLFVVCPFKCCRILLKLKLVK